MAHVVESLPGSQTARGGHQLPVAAGPFNRARCGCTRAHSAVSTITKVGAIGLDIAVLACLLWLNWPPEAALGY